ncbi:MFS transporter [Gordonia otitidis]|uniref:MFS transporter n=1 Tax=Gordonia otitidis TaxID=249058 RepID=UPI002355739C|nr:MFS transporter [Gordonia otitidis]
MVRVRAAPLVVASTAQLMLVLDVSVVNVAMPALQSELRMSGAGVQWVATAYALVFAGGLLVGGRLADVRGVRATLCGGLAVFVVASAIAGLAGSGAVLVAARAIQGVGAAVASPATLTVLTRTYAEGPERTTAIAVWTAVSLVGGAAGNIIGGALTDLLSWRAIFLVNVPIGILVIAVARHVLDDTTHTPTRIDVVGAVLITITLCACTLAVAQADGGSVVVASGAAALALVAAGSAAAQQRRSSAPLIPKSLWRNRTVVFANFLTLVTGMCFQAPIWLFLTYVMQTSMGMSALAAGIGFVPMAATMMVVGTMCAPRAMERVSASSLVAFGALVAAAGFCWLAAVSASGGYLTAVLGPSLVIGVGAGVVNTPLTTLTTQGVAPDDSGAASGMMNTAKQFGGALGLAALTPLTAGYSDFTVGFTTMAAAMVVVAATSVLYTVNGTSR